MSATQSTGPDAPIFTPEPAYAHRLAVLADAVGRAIRAGAPEPCSVSVSADMATITPWLPGAPLQGLFAWAEHLTDPQWSAQIHPPLQPSGQIVTSVYVTGLLVPPGAGRESGDALTVELAASSWRPIPGVFGDPGAGRHPVDPRELARLAAAEEPYGALR